MGTSCKQTLIYVTILNRPIPVLGRYITRREVKLLQAQDVRCSVKWRVYRKNDSPAVGTLFKPENRELIDTGIEVRAKPKKYPI